MEKKIIKRWSFISSTNESAVYKILSSYCEKILEGWKFTEKGRKFVEKYDLKTPQTFRLISMSPSDLLEQSFLTVHYLILYLITPKTKRELRLFSSFRQIVYFLNSYGILNRIENKYEQPYLEIFQHSLERVRKHTGKIKKYVSAVELREENKSIREIFHMLNININTLHSWFYKGVKPWPLPEPVTDILRKAGILSLEEIEKFKKYGMVYSGECYKSS